MKKILITTTTYPLTSDDSQPRFVHDLAKNLSHKFDISILTPRGPGGLNKEEIDGVTVNRYAYFFSRFETLVYEGGILENLRKNSWNYLLIPLLLLSQLFSTLHYVKKNKILIINAHWIIPQGFIAVFLKKYFRIPVKVVVTSHGGDLYGLQGKSLNYVKRWVLEQADSVVVVSSAMRSYCYESLKVDNSTSISVRSMGVDLKNKFVHRIEMQHRQDLVFVGRLAEKKGLPVLLKAISILRSKHVDVHLRVVGDGSQMEVFQALTNLLKLENCVTFEGAKRNIEIPDILNAHQCFIMPSIVANDGDQEGLGLVAVEAMGCGCAVIVSDLPALRDVVENGKTGLTFPAGDAEALAEKIELLTLDERYMLKLALAGEESVADKFDWSKVVADYANIYNSI